MRLRATILALPLATGMLVATTVGASAAPFQVTMSTDAGAFGTYVTIRIDTGADLGGPARTPLFLVPPVATGSGSCSDAPGGAEVGALRWHQEGSNFVGTGSFTVADLAPGRYALAQVVPDVDQNGSSVGQACFELASFRVLPGMPDGALPAPAGLRGSTALGLLALVAGLTGLVLPSKLRSRSTISA